MLNTVINLGSLFLDLAKRLYPESAEIGAAANVADKAKYTYNVLNTQSVTQSANRALIAPMVVIEDEILHQEYMGDLMQVVMLRDIVATLTHLSLQSAVDTGVRVSDLVGGINPNRAGLMAYSGVEAYSSGPRNTANDAGADDKEDKTPKNTVMVGGKEMPNLNEFTPLAIGKVVQAVVYGSNGNKVEFPLTFRQVPIPVNSRDFGLIFSAAKNDDGLMARLLMYKTSEITGPELMTGKDIIKEKFRIKNQEMSGYYKEAVKRESGNRLAAIRSGVVSVNSLANTFILSQDRANQVELQIGKRFSDPRSREKIFHAVKANTIVVCNEDRGVFTFYTNGMDIPETYTRRDLSGKVKKDPGNSLADLVKLLNGGM